jgi:acyl-CoA reductase-like NAD-dependent aldehyde dehydrogenase
MRNAADTIKRLTLELGGRARRSCSTTPTGRRRFLQHSPRAFGDPQDPATGVGPVVSQKQFGRVQSYIRLGWRKVPRS